MTRLCSALFVLILAQGSLPKKSKKHILIDFSFLLIQETSIILQSGYFYLIIYTIFCYYNKNDTLGVSCTSILLFDCSLIGVDTPEDVLLPITSKVLSQPLMCENSSTFVERIRKLSYNIIFIICNFVVNQPIIGKFKLSFWRIPDLLDNEIMYNDNTQFKNLHSYIILF